MFFVQVEAGLMEVVLSINGTWICDTYFSYIKLSILEEKSGGNVRGGKCTNTMSTQSVNNYYDQTGGIHCLFTGELIQRLLTIEI